jgi:hypothetical protein
MLHVILIAAVCVLSLDALAVMAWAARWAYRCRTARVAGASSPAVLSREADQVLPAAQLPAIEAPQWSWTAQQLSTQDTAAVTQKAGGE